MIKIAEMNQLVMDLKRARERAYAYVPASGK